jgi:hypothetical protein
LIAAGSSPSWPGKVPALSVRRSVSTTSHQRSIVSSRETRRRPQRSRSASPMKRPNAASRSGVGEMMHPANCAAACSIKSSYSLTRHPHRVHSRACRRADDEHAPATRSLLFTRPAVDAVATQVNFVRHDPSLTRSLSGRMSVGVQSDPTKLATPTAACPWVRAGAASCLNYAPHRGWQ